MEGAELENMHKLQTAVESSNKMDSLQLTRLAVLLLTVTWPATSQRPAARSNLEQQNQPGAVQPLLQSSADRSLKQALSIPASHTGKYFISEFWGSTRDNRSFGHGR